MAKRKTVTVEYLRAKFNGHIQTAANESERKALCCLLESILFDTGNYNGFNFVEWLEGGAERWRQDAQDNVDERFPKGLGSQVPQSYLGPEYLRRYY